MVSEIVATVASSIFAGAAVYVNLVEQPARLSYCVQLAVTEWRPSYKRGTLMQVPLALIGSLSALVSWWSDGGRAWLVGELFLLLVIPSLSSSSCLLTRSWRARNSTWDRRKRTGSCDVGGDSMRFAVS